MVFVCSRVYKYPAILPEAAMMWVPLAAQCQQSQYPAILPEAALMWVPLAAQCQQSQYPAILPEAALIWVPLAAQCQQSQCPAILREAALMWVPLAAQCQKSMYPAILARDCPDVGATGCTVPAVTVNGSCLCSDRMAFCSHAQPIQIEPITQTRVVKNMHSYYIRFLRDEIFLILNFKVPRKFLNAIFMIIFVAKCSTWVQFMPVVYNETWRV